MHLGCHSLQFYIEPNPPCENGEIRLTNGRIPSEGRIEICFNGHWGTICHDGWDSREARVVCREIGYPGNSEYCMYLKLCVHARVKLTSLSPLLKFIFCVTDII